MRSHVAMLCETAPSSQNSAVCLHSIGLVFRFTHATTPLHMYVPHPILRWLNYKGTNAHNSCKLHCIKSYPITRQSWPSGLCMHACTEGKQISRMCFYRYSMYYTCNTIMVTLILPHRAARGCDRGWDQGTGEANDRGTCTHTLRPRHITYNAWSEQRFNAFSNKIDHC